MALDTKPVNHSERDQIVSASNAYRMGTAPDAAVAALDDRIFATARSTYVTSRSEYQAAVAASRTASDAADVGDAAFDTAFRLWARTVTDAEGKSLSGELSKFMNGTKPNELVGLPYRQELNTFESLSNKLPDNPKYQGEADKYAALQAAYAALVPLVEADEAATRDMLDKGKALGAATAAFDRSYSKYLRAVRALLGDERAFAIFPRFVRPDPRTDDGGGTE